MPAARVRRSAAAWSVTAAFAAAAVAAAPAVPATPTVTRPAPGRHAAELCVTTLPRPPSCGPVQVDLRADGSARVRVDDLVYRLQLHSSQVDVVLMHGFVQVDDFSAPFEWVGRALRFEDAERQVRYELRFEPAKKTR